MENMIRVIQEISEVANNHQQNEKNIAIPYNLFSVLNMETNEVKHSLFIADLLNPKGAHGMGISFLELFLDVMPKEFSNVILDNKPENIVVEVERNVGEIDADYLKGGFIDILIENKKNSSGIIIEAKINASDQRNQLLRYQNYAKGRYRKENWILLYLTPKGKNPSEFSLGENSQIVEYSTISFQKEILCWLMKCVELKDLPCGVKTAIHQYMCMINKMTKNIMSTIEEKEVFDILKKLSENELNNLYRLNRKMEEKKDEIRSIIFSAFHTPLEYSFGNQYKLVRSPLEDDYEGVYFNYTLFKNNNPVEESDGDKVFELCRHKFLDLTNMNEGFLNPKNIGWYTPKPLLVTNSESKSFAHISPKTLLKWAADPGELDLVIREIKGEESKIWKALTSN